MVVDRILNVEHDMQRLRMHLKKKDIDLSEIDEKLGEWENILGQIREAIKNSN